MDGNGSLISVGIIAAIVAAFGLAGFICCYFKKKCNSLNEQDTEFNYARNKSKSSNASHILSLHSETSVDESTTSSYTNRRTLFQIVIGLGPSDKPLRAREERKSTLLHWSSKLSFLRKPQRNSTSVNNKNKRHGKYHSRRTPQCDLTLTPMEETIEDDPNFANCSRTMTL